MIVLGGIFLLSMFVIGHSQGPVRCSSSDPSCCESGQFCIFWSQNGECQKNPSWMLANCKVSCNGCGVSTSAPVRPVPVPQPPVHDPAAPEGCSSVQTSESIFTLQQAPQQYLASGRRIGCGTATRPRDCNANLCFHKKFRSFDGVCNNFQNPAKGAAYTANPRLLHNNYDDGVNAVTDSLKRLRPNPRVVSHQLLATNQAINLNVSSIFMQFGQFLSHDITRNTIGMTGCSCSSVHPQCANIPQAFINGRVFPCFPYERSVAECGTGFAGRPREQMNMNTAFIDGSGLYGSDAVSARSLRFGALLQTSTFQGRPQSPNPFRGGDERNSLISGVGALQTIFIRLHNKIATQLMGVNPRWNQERVFQEARKIVGAMLQVVVYKEFLPAMLGPIGSRKVPPFSGYNSNVDPSILNEFAGAAYRIHGLIHESFPLLDQNFREIGRYTFFNALNDANRVARTHLDFVLRGLIGTPARAPQRISFNVANGAFDLAVVSLHRGRDQGFAPYNDYRRQCGLPSITSFDSWPEVPEAAVVARVKQLYPHGADTMDLYVGGLLETPENGSVMGPTFSCIIAEQFKRLRDGDRFYFENSGIFTPEQIIALRRVTLSWILCSNGDAITNITPQSFFTDRGLNAVSCSSLQSFDLNPWRDNN